MAKYVSLLYISCKYKGLRVGSKRCFSNPTLTHTHTQKCLYSAFVSKRCQIGSDMFFFTNYMLLAMQ